MPKLYKKGIDTMKKLGKVMFDNDTTNILSCTSPYHQPGSVFDRDMLNASIDETAGTGIDIHLLQPGLGWVPWWKNSKMYPFEEHIEFMKRFGQVPENDGFANYMAKGGDIVGDFVERCREKGLSPFISFRLNDGHGHDYITMENKDIPGWSWHCFSKFHVEHSDWRLGTSMTDWNERVLNFAIPEVRELKLGFIKEIIAGYDLDGFELDFMRHPSYFRVDEVPSAERRAIMRGFVSEVRRALDESTPAGRSRKMLSVRVPCYLESHDLLGICLPELVECGVDMVNLTQTYFHTSDNDVADVCALIPNTPVYYEILHTTVMGKKRPELGFYSVAHERLTTKEQIYTAAHLAYRRGAYGISAFNFVYYRQYADSPTAFEPPFEVFEHLGDEAWLARQPQHYTISAVSNCPRTSRIQLPTVFDPKVSKTYTLDMSAPEGGWSGEGKLRLECEDDMCGAVFSVRFNGVPLEPTDDISEPYPSPYDDMLGNAGSVRAYRLPAALAREGINKIYVIMDKGKGVKINYIDVALS